MQVEAGKYYLRRDGEVAGPMARTPKEHYDEEFRRWCPRYQLSYNDSGKWVAGTEHSRDLIAECDEQGNPVDPEALATEFRPGTWWEANNGDRVYCVGANPAGEPLLQNSVGRCYAPSSLETWCKRRGVAEVQWTPLPDCTGWDWESKPEPEPEASIENLVAWLKERQRDWECQRTDYCDEYSKGYAKGAANMCGHALRWIRDHLPIEPKETP